MKLEKNQRMGPSLTGYPMPPNHCFNRQVKKGQVDRSIFDGSTINTPSMLCVEDYIDALQWTDTVGGLNGLIKRSEVRSRIQAVQAVCVQAAAAAAAAAAYRGCSTS